MTAWIVAHPWIAILILLVLLMWTGLALMIGRDLWATHRALQRSRQQMAEDEAAIRKIRAERRPFGSDQHREARRASLRAASGGR